MFLSIDEGDITFAANKELAARADSAEIIDCNEYTLKDLRKIKTALCEFITDSLKTRQFVTLSPLDKRRAKGCHILLRGQFNYNVNSEQNEPDEYIISDDLDFLQSRQYNGKYVTEKTYYKKGE